MIIKKQGNCRKGLIITTSKIRHKHIDKHIDSACYVEEILYYDTCLCGCLLIQTQGNFC